VSVEKLRENEYVTFSNFLNMVPTKVMKNPGKINFPRKSSKKVKSHGKNL